MSQFSYRAGLDENAFLTIIRTTFGLNESAFDFFEPDYIRVHFSNLFGSDAHVDQPRALIWV